MPKVDLIKLETPPRGLATRLKRAVEALLLELGHHDNYVTIILTSDKELERLKRKHWGERVTTDVLSFPTYEPGDPFVPKHLGDIFINLQEASRNALSESKDLAARDRLANRTRKKPGLLVSEEVLVLAAHGLWHLLGHDHATEKEWQGFHRIQKRILSL